MPRLRLATIGILLAASACAPDQPLPTGIAAGPSCVPVAAAAGVTTLTGTAEAPRHLLGLSGATLRLADLRGHPIPGLASVQADAAGRFTLPDVPVGYPFVLAAVFKAPSGREVVLKTLVRASAGGGAVVLDAASTLVTEAAAAGRRGLVTDFDAEAFEAARTALAGRLTAEAMPDLTRPETLSAAVEALASTDATLRDALARLEAALDRPAPRPTPTPAPAASVIPTPSAATPTPGVPTREGAIVIRDFKFHPDRLTIDQGDSLVFINEDGQGHTVLPFDDTAFEAPDTIPALRQSAAVVFAKPGEIRYRCGIHPGEEGVVVVRDTGAPDPTPTPELTADPSASPSATPTPVPTPTPAATPTPTPGTVITVVTSTAFNAPEGLAIDAEGNFYVADTAANKIFKVRRDGVITLLAGSGTFGFANGSAQVAAFRSPKDIAVDGAGFVYVADTMNHRIRRINQNLPASDPAYVITLAGGASPGSTDGVGAGALFREPSGLSIDGNGTIFVADTGNHMVRAIHPNGNVERLGGTGTAAFRDGAAKTFSLFSSPVDTGVDLTSRVFVVDRGNSAVRRFNGDFSTVTTPFGVNPPALTATSPVSAAAFDAPQSIAHGPADAVYLTHTGRHAIRRFLGTTLSVLSGHDTEFGHVDGPLSQARFNQPHGLAGDSHGNLYVMDTGNRAIRRISP